VTFTGSIVAFLKLAEKMSSRPLMPPARHLTNGSLFGVNLAAMGGFLAAAPAVPVVAAVKFGLNMLLMITPMLNRGHPVSLCPDVGGIWLSCWPSFSIVTDCCD